MVSTFSSWKEIESALSSKGRLRILKSLYKNLPSSLTKYRLARETGLNQTKIKNHLKILTEIGWVLEGSITPKTYRLNLDNPLIKSLSPFLEAIKETD